LESHPICLDFHHVNPGEKERGLNKIVNTHNKKLILEEISKCIVLCANCHRKEHFKEVD